MKRILASLFAISLFVVFSCFATAQKPQNAGAGGSFQLKIFEGYDFPNQQVVKSGSSTADLNFTYQTRRIGMISYLSAARIKQFNENPSGLSATQVESWEDYAAGPSPGYYVVKSRAGRYYLVTLKKFENQGKAASYWTMSFDWKEIVLGVR